MRAWVVAAPGSIDTGPLVPVARPVAVPGASEIRVKVAVCGVCRTDLHLAEGDLAPRRPGVVPGHEIVGVVDAVGEGSTRFQLGERAGIAWLRRTCGRCRWCRRSAAILFAPAGGLVPVALAALDRGGTLAVAVAGAGACGTSAPDSQPLPTVPDSTIDELVHLLGW